MNKTRAEKEERVSSRRKKIEMRMAQQSTKLTCQRWNGGEAGEGKRWKKAKKIQLKIAI